MNKNSIQHFEKEFQAKVTFDQRKMHVIPPINIDFNNFNRCNNATYEIKTVSAVEILIPDDRFYELIKELDKISEDNLHWITYNQYRNTYGSDWPYRFSDMLNRQKQEEKLRDSNAALKKAWEHYQLLLKMS